MSKACPHRDRKRTKTPGAETHRRAVRNFEIDSSSRPGRGLHGTPERSGSQGVDPEHARHARQLERTNEDLRRANRQLEEFAYIASHDLREPLRMVNIYTQLLIQRCGPACDPRAHEFAHHIQHSVARMESLIQDLLQVSQVLYERGALPSARVSLRDAVDQALAVFREPMKVAGAHIEIGDLPVVLGDEIQLALVFQNLFSNSLKYAHPERPVSIRIQAQRRRHDAIIHFSDNGIGFEPEFAERIFGLFKRLHGRDVPGNGLGLAICREIIERHSGQMHAEGVPQRGATFIFTLKTWNCHEPGECGCANSAGRGQPG